MENIYMKILKNIIITAAMLAAATAICFILRPLVPTDTHVPLIYVLAVAFVYQSLQKVFLWSAGLWWQLWESIIYLPIHISKWFYCDRLSAYIYCNADSIYFSKCIDDSDQDAGACAVKGRKRENESKSSRAVSHDIRTPLTSIEGAAAGIIDNKDVLTEEQKEELLLNIKEEAQWMVRMVENLLSITRMNDEGTRLTTHEELAEEIVSSAVVKFSKRFPDIKVEVDIPEEVVIVPMDPILIRQVIVNIMENAVIHGGTTTQVKVTISANETEAIFSIEDNGKGIDGKILPMLFTGQISHREGETYDNKRSMGIGLSVCKSIIDAHRGKVWAENKIDGGAKISFTLPLEEEEQNGD